MFEVLGNDGSKRTVRRRWGLGAMVTACCCLGLRLRGCRAWVQPPLTARIACRSPPATSAIRRGRTFPGKRVRRARVSVLSTSTARDVTGDAFDGVSSSSCSPYDLAPPYLNASIASCWVPTPSITIWEDTESRESAPTQHWPQSRIVDPNGIRLASPLQESERIDGVVKPGDESNKQAVLWARLLLVGAACLYGTSFSLVKLMGDSDLPVGMSSAIRFGMAALVTSPWLLATSHKSDDNTGAPHNTRYSSDAWHAVVAGFQVGLCNSIGYVAQAVGLETTAASTSAFLCSLAVVVVPFLDVWSGKQLKGRQWAGAILAMMGVGMLELRNGFDGSWSYGDVASMLQPFAFAFGFLHLESAMHKYPTEGKRSTAAQILAVFLGCVLYTIVMEDVSIDQVHAYLSDPMTLGMVTFTGVISTALSIYMESVALKTLTAAETTVLLSTEPLWGALFASLLVGEQVGMDTVAGGLMILAGCLYSSLGWNRLKGLAFGRLERTATSSRRKNFPTLHSEEIAGRNHHQHQQQHRNTRMQPQDPL